MTVTDMPDPDSIYSSLLGTGSMSKCIVDIPNVRDGNGAIIKPTEYDTKLQSGTIVMVNVYMKMYVLTIHTFRVY